jgi:hypothetical protein
MFIVLVLGSATLFSGGEVAVADGAHVSDRVTTGGFAKDACVALVSFASWTHGQPDLTKTVVRADREDGSSEFTITLVGHIPDRVSVASFIDCVWIDSSGDGRYTAVVGERMRSYTQGNVAITGSNPNRTAVFQIDVPGAAGKRVCDRVFGSSKGRGSLASRTRFFSRTSFFSDRVCTAASPPAEVPETGTVALLALSGGATGLLVLAVLRRRRSAVAA